MKKINVMITSVGGIVGQGLIKSLKYHNSQKNNKDYRYNILGTDLTFEACGLYRIDKFSIISKPENKNYLNSIIKLCNENNIQVLLVGSDLELSTLSKNKETIERETGTKIVINQPEIVDLCRDKYMTFKFLFKNDLNYIPSCLIEEVEDFVKDYKYPLVVKPREGFGSKQFFIVRDPKELSYAIKSIEQIGWRPIIQKYIKNDNNEYTTGITVDKEGKSIMSSITMKKALKHGQTYKAFINKYTKINKTCEKIVKRLGVKGPINIQTKVDEDDKKIKVIEINPRFSASTPMRAVAGVNEPDLIIRNTLFDEKISISDYKQLVCLRYWNETYLDLQSFEKVKTERKKIHNLNSRVIEYF